MSVQQGNLRTLLELFPRYELKRMVSQRDLEFKSRKSEEYVDKLVEQDWTADEIQSLRHRLSVLNEEEEPFNRYVFKLSNSPDLKLIEEKLSRNEVTYNAEQVPIEGGYETTLDEVRLEGTRWRVSEDKEYNRYIDKVVVTPKISAAHFALDLNRNIMYIGLRWLFQMR